MSGLRHDEGYGAEAESNDRRSSKDLLCRNRKREKRGESEGWKERNKEIEETSASYRPRNKTDPSFCKRQERDTSANTQKLFVYPFFLSSFCSSFLASCEVAAQQSTPWMETVKARPYAHRCPACSCHLQDIYPYRCSHPSSCSNYCGQSFTKAIITRQHQTSATWSLC